MIRLPNQNKTQTAIKPNKKIQKERTNKISQVSLTIRTNKQIIMKNKSLIIEKALRAIWLNANQYFLFFTILIFPPVLPIFSFYAYSTFLFFCQYFCIFFDIQFCYKQITQIFFKLLIVMATRAREYDHFLKYVIVGDSSVGKSCLLLRFADDQFNQNYMTTIGVDFRFKTVKSNAKNVKLQIWDTAGQERFRTITNTYYKSAHAVILVYDITNNESLESIKNFWIDEVQNYADPGTLLVLVGNKADLRQNQVVSTEAAQEFAKSKGMLFFQTSAKTAQHVQESFMGVTSELVKKLGQGQAAKKPQGTQRMALGTQQQQKKRTGCCY